MPVRMDFTNYKVRKEESPLCWIVGAMYAHIHQRGKESHRPKTSVCSFKVKVYFVTTAKIAYVSVDR